MVTSSTKFARYSGMRFVKHFKVSLSFYLLGEHAHLKTLSFKISNILQSILNFSLDIFDSLVQVSYAQDKSACVSFNFPHFTQKAYIYSIRISGEEINDIDLVDRLSSSVNRGDIGSLKLHHLIGYVSQLNFTITFHMTNFLR